MSDASSPRTKLSTAKEVVESQVSFRNSVASIQAEMRGHRTRARSLSRMSWKTLK
jgi:hypothetical protein